MSLPGGLAVTALATLALFLVTFAVAVAKGRHAIVDVVWGLGFVLVAAVSFGLSGGHGDGGAGRSSWA